MEPFIDRRARDGRGGRIKDRKGKPDVVGDRMVLDLPAPHGGTLKELIPGEPERLTLRAEAVRLPSWSLTHKQVCDLELLLNGAFSPLTGFMAAAEYESVVRTMRLADGTLWPIPITLDVTAEFAETLAIGDRCALRHPEGNVLAVLTVTDVWRPDLTEEARRVYGTSDEAHSGVWSLYHQSNPFYIGGLVEGLELPPHHTFRHLRHTPAQLRELFRRRGWTGVVAFQTRNPMHRAHVELVKRAARENELTVLLHPAVGRTSPMDVDYFARVRCYQALLKHFPKQTTVLSLLPLAMRMAGPREALWHAIIRKNYGSSHFIVGRDHASPGKDGDGRPFYPAYSAQELIRQHQDALGCTMLGFEEMVYVEELARYTPASQAPASARALSLSGTELRRRLREGLEIPDWFSYPEVIAELRRSYPPRAQQGFTVLFTGLSGAGKSTIAGVFVAKLMEDGSRPVTLLDGDIVRKHLSSELGFSKQHRDLNVRRVGFVAREITKNRGVAVCPLIAPYRDARSEIRRMISEFGGFVEVYVATPLDVCETRDKKGLYAGARAGLIKDFTGIDDPYEVPDRPEVIVDASTMTPEEAADRVLAHLKRQGFIDDVPAETSAELK